VIVATMNSSGLTRKIPLIPLRSINRTPIKNTTEESTAFGMYASGPVRKSKTMLNAKNRDKDPI